MSVRGLNKVAIQREEGGARMTLAGPTAPQGFALHPTGRGEGRPPAKTAPSTDETGLQGYMDLLVTAIPTEPLALYTFLVAGIVATIDPGTDQRLLMRWIIFGVAVAFIAAWMIAVYLRRPKEERDRTLPWAELGSAVVAFAAWGLVMPESPLAAELSGSDQTVWTFIVVAAGVAVLGLLTGTMKKPVESE